MEEDPIAGPEGPATPIERLLRRLELFRSLPDRRGTAHALRSPSPVLDEAVRFREPPVDVVRIPRCIYVTIEFPGASRETIDIEAAEGRLAIRARDREGRVYRKEIRLPDPSDPQTVRAEYRNGVLDITIPRRRHRVFVGGGGRNEG